MVVSLQHCLYCFDVLVAHLNGSRVPDPDFENSAYPLFVTWNVAGRDADRLRGCIGNFNPLPLHQGLKDYAIARDHRFEPVTAKELYRLSCSVSLLADFSQAKDCMDWEIGVHGIWIDFRDEGGRKRTATYLPEVAAEQGWTKDEAIESLLRKGGYRSTITPGFLVTVKLTRYRSHKLKVKYGEWLKVRNSSINNN